MTRQRAHSRDFGSLLTTWNHSISAYCVLQVILDTVSSLQRQLNRCCSRRQTQQGICRPWIEYTFCISLGILVCLQMFGIDHEHGAHRSKYPSQNRQQVRDEFLRHELCRQGAFLSILVIYHDIVTGIACRLQNRLVQSLFFLHLLRGCRNCSLQINQNITTSLLVNFQFRYSLYFKFSSDTVVSLYFLL